MSQRWLLTLCVIPLTLGTIVVRHVHQRPSIQNLTSHAILVSPTAAASFEQPIPMFAAQSPGPPAPETVNASANAAEAAARAAAKIAGDH